MPLRDHFENPERRIWERVHGGGPMVMVQYLVRVLPPRDIVAPQVRLNQYFSLDIAPSGGGVATAVCPIPVWVARPASRRRDDPSPVGAQPALDATYEETCRTVRMASLGACRFPGTAPSAPRTGSC